MLVLMEVTVEQVSPVVRPLLATAWLSAGVARVADGCAAAILLAPAAPRSKMLPFRSTAPVVISAIAESVLLGEGPVPPAATPVGLSAACCCSVATGLEEAPKHAPCPG